MKLASTLLLVLNLGASAASDKQLHLRGGGEEYARRLTLTNTTDAPTVSSAPTASPAPSTSEPTAAPSQKPTEAPTSEPTPAPSQKPTVPPTSKPTTAPTNKPTLKPCSADVLVPIGYYDDYDWNELPVCVQEAAEMFGYDQNIWDSGQKSCPWWCNEWWDDLTSRQRWAARVFGYNRTRWNSS